MPSLATFTARAVSVDYHQLPTLGDYLSVGVHHLDAAGSVICTTGSCRTYRSPSHDGSASGSPRYARIAHGC
jgi:hypothetical protein